MTGYIEVDTPALFLGGDFTFTNFSMTETAGVPPVLDPTSELITNGGFTIHVNEAQP